MKVWCIGISRAHTLSHYHVPQLVVFKESHWLKAVGRTQAYPDYYCLVVPCIVAMGYTILVWCRRTMPTRRTIVLVCLILVSSLLRGYIYSTVCANISILLTQRIHRHIYPPLSVICPTVGIMARQNQLPICAMSPYCLQHTLCKACSGSLRVNTLWSCYHEWCSCKVSHPSLFEVTLMISGSCMQRETGNQMHKYNHFLVYMCPVKVQYFEV